MAQVWPWTWKTIIVTLLRSRATYILYVLNVIIVDQMIISIVQKLNFVNRWMNMMKPGYPSPF